MSIYRRNAKVMLSVFFIFVALVISAIRMPQIFAANVVPSSIRITADDTNVCSVSEKFSVKITLPTISINDKVDVFLLFDDTGSFANFIPTVTSIFSNLVSTLEATVPGIDFGFGVGRFEDYGGPGTGFSLDDATARPFILSQPIVTATDAGGDVARDTLISDALLRTTPGFGGDKPEAAIAEGLYQVATGIGFDGDGNGNTLGSGPADDSSTQTSPGISGDVPAFSSNVALTSGTLGGVGWRSDALHLVILATDVCTIAAFPAGTTFPTTITGVGGSEESHTTFTCSTNTGTDRFGFVSDSKTEEDNTVRNAVVPAGAGTVQKTIDALNALGIRVIGMGPGAAPTTLEGPSFDESVFLSSLARLTGAVDDSGDPLVFSTSVSLSDLTASIVNAISTIVTLPVDISLDTSALPLGLSFDFTPPVITIPLGDMAPFVVTLKGEGTSIEGPFTIKFVDKNSLSVLGEIPSTVSCKPTVVTLVSFTATSTLRTAHIRWETATEIDSVGFNIWRSEGDTGRYTKINDSLLSSEGGVTWGAEYSYNDTDIVPGRTYSYQLEDVEIDGTSTLHGPVRVTVNTKLKELRDKFQN